MQNIIHARSVEQKQIHNYLGKRHFYISFSDNPYLFGKKEIANYFFVATFKG
jgi:hypothetical protein